MSDMPKRRDAHPELMAPSTDLDLEARIALAEQAVIERDERIRARAGLIMHRAQHGLLKHTGWGLGAAVGGLALTWFLSHRAGRSGHHARPDPMESVAREAGFSLAGLLPLIWPFLPGKVKKHVTPGMVSTLMAVATPLLSWALGRGLRGKRR
ncbi:MAG TPA: hypothetical protein VH328_01225 [Burkholderiaceae bacterium]|nr:hypothetical protein [Burkholderiaceae bacterium]